MDIYNSILKTNQNHKHRQAMSITMASGEVRKYTYETLFEEANIYANRLIDAGILAGDRIVLVAENSPQWQAAFLAIMQIQGTAVLIDPDLSDELLRACIEKADARGIFTSTKIKEKLGTGANYRVPMFNLTKGGQTFSDSYKVLSPFVERTKDPMSDVAIIFFEVDNKQEIKGIMYTHEAMIRQVKSVARENMLSRSERILSLIPSWKIEGMVACVLPVMLIGASIHYIEVLDQATLSKAFNSFKPTIFPASKHILKQLMDTLLEKLETQRFGKEYLDRCEKVRQKTGVKLGNILFKQIHKEFGGKLDLIWCYGPIEREIMHFYYALGIDILLHYGRTETNIPVIGNREDDITLDTCGRPYPDMEIKLVNPNEQGEGEMYIKAPYGMLGYFRDETTYEAQFEEGWFKTGTIARLADDRHVMVLYPETEETSISKEEQDRNEIKPAVGLPNKTSSAYYWFTAWRKTAQSLYKVTIEHEEYLPEVGGYIIYSPFETTKGYLGLTVGYSKERFFKFGYLTNETINDKLKLENEAFGKIQFDGKNIDEKVQQTCIEQLNKGWCIIIQAPKDAINARFTEEVIQLAQAAKVPIIPAYLEGEEAIFSGKEDQPRLFDIKAQKRYPLTLRYAKPISVEHEMHSIKREIQEKFIALIENYPEEEPKQPVDELTKVAMEMLSMAEEIEDKVGEEIGKEKELERELEKELEKELEEELEEETMIAIKSKKIEESIEKSIEENIEENKNEQLFEEEDTQIQRMDLKSLLAIDEDEAISE